MLCVPAAESSSRYPGQTSDGVTNRGVNDYLEKIVGGASEAKRVRQAIFYQESLTNRSAARTVGAGYLVMALGFAGFATSSCVPAARSDSGNWLLKGETQ
jgi:hypothetical protein